MASLNKRMFLIILCLIPFIYTYKLLCFVKETFDYIKDNTTYIK